MNGFLFVDKPKGWTSFDVVRRISAITLEKKIGHAGTLDKLAEGLMILAFGEATKLLEYLIGLDKEYEVSARFGEVSETYDAEGPVVQVDGFDPDRILEKFNHEGVLKLIENAVVEDFLGEIEQIPPRYSALKIAGKRASDRVRAGEKVEMKSRKIRIDGFEIGEVNWPEVSFTIRCSSGTYVRSLIHDLGQKLKWGAYVRDLRRSRIGNFDIGDEKVFEMGEYLEIGQRLISIEDFVRHKIIGDCQIMELEDSEFLKLKDGAIVVDKRVQPDLLNVAFHNSKVVGILENFRGGMKFRKRIF